MIHARALQLLCLWDIDGQCTPGLLPIPLQFVQAQQNSSWQRTSCAFRSTYLGINDSCALDTSFQTHITLCHHVLP